MLSLVLKMRSGKIPQSAMNMWLIVLAVFAVKVYAKNCDQLGVLLYEDLGCTPTFGNNVPCPSKFSCVGLSKSKNCVYKGIEVPIPKEANNTLSPPCLRGCFCSEGVDGPKFACPAIDCPNFQPNPGCYFKANLNSCCNSEQQCPPYDDTVKCEVNGKTYKENEKFSSRTSCFDCICKKGWDGQFKEPFCQRQKCGAQLTNQQKVQRSCAPVYISSPFFFDPGTLCCPSLWTCPEGTEVVKGSSTSNEVCNFGNKKLKVGQWFTKIVDYYSTPKTVTCKCQIPPLLTCSD